MQLIQRHLANRILAALKISPIVFVNGPRQAGKSTLVQHLAQSTIKAEYVTFDNPTQMSAAVAAPQEFLENRHATLIIDEVQMVPDIFRTLKSVVDNLRHEKKSKANGRFLLTGSANIMALPKLSDPLVGRMNVMTLYPFSAAEILTNGKNLFLEKLFQNEFSISPKSKINIIDIIQLATFPEISGKSFQERTLWFDGYITTILQRDIRMLAELDKIAILPNLLHILAARAGKLLNDADIARDIGLNPVTSKQYRYILQMMFLNFDVRPWYRNISKRLVKSAKGYIVDTLLLCRMLDLQLENVQAVRPELFGHIVENFIASELLKLLSFSALQVTLYHFRTSDNKKVDFVLEKADGKIAAIEVKTREKIEAADFNGLRELQTHVPNDFVCGIVLYRGREIVPFGKKLWAVPFSILWQND